MEILEALGNIGFDWRLTIANIVNFALVYFVLKRLVFAPLGNILKERQDKIEEGLQKAKDAETLHQKASDDREQILRAARQEAATIVGAAKSKEEEIVGAAAEKAQKEADKIVSEARAKTENEHAEMLKDFRSEAGSLVIAAAEKLLQDEIAAPEKQEVAKKYLQTTFPSSSGATK